MAVQSPERGRVASDIVIRRQSNALKPPAHRAREITGQIMIWLGLVWFLIAMFGA